MVAFYPGPAGATESELPLDAWRDLEGANRHLATCSPTSRLCSSEPRAGRGSAASEAYIVPIDACYELVGQMRRLWRGFDGGQDAHDAIDSFFGRLRARTP